MKFTAQQIADFLQGTVEGDPNATVSTFAKIEEGKPEALSFLANAQYTPYLYDTASSIVLVNQDFQAEKEVKTTLVRVSNAYEAVAKLLQMYEQSKPQRKGVSPLAAIAESAQVGEDCYVGAFAVVGENVVVGDRTQIYPHAVIEAGATVGCDCILYPHASVYHDCQLGDRVILHSGAVVGADGFGFAPTAEGYDKIPQIGIVIVKDDVEIGANACVDRSTMGATVIHKGVKIDNLVQIAHNCEVGAHTVMSAQVGVAGSTKIGERCMFGGQVGIAGHITIADRTQSGAQAGIAGSIRQPGTAVHGTPAIAYSNFTRASVVYKKLPEMYKELHELKAEVAALKATLSHP